ncbi:hypothetical protein KY342_07105 [Candidatus Woesearchaeota archaeon]|nr:hypothetical protein [Candidatus Woesearchaeota archaeon]
MILRPRDFISTEDDKKLPMPTLPKVNEDHPKDVIVYDERTFEAPFEMLRYFSELPDIIPKSIERAYQKGMGYMYPDGVYGCHYCNHYTKNIAKLVLEDDSELSTKIKTKGGTCRYEEHTVKWAAPVKNKITGTIHMAQRKPCVVSEAKIEIFVEEGLLNNYEVQGREFDFPTLEELTNNFKMQQENHTIQENHTVIPEKKGFFKTMYDRLKNLLG